MANDGKTGYEVLLEGVSVALVAIAKLRAEHGIQVRCSESEDGTITGAERNQLYQDAFRWIVDQLPGDNPFRAVVEQMRFTGRVPDDTRYAIFEKEKKP